MVNINYALLNDMKTVIHINEAKKQDAHFLYFCDECKGALIIKHGPINRKHFAHKPGENKHCESRFKGSGESTIHKYWKNHFASLKGDYFTYHKKILLEDTNTIDTVLVKGFVVEAVKEKPFPLKNGTVVKPDVLLTIRPENQQEDEFIAIEICYKNKKSKKYKWIYQELGIHAIEVFVDVDDTRSSDIIYSKGQELLYGQKYKNKSFESVKEAKGFIKKVFDQAEKWEKKNHFKPDVPRYVYNVRDEENEDAVMFFTTRKTFERVQKSYSHLFDIYPSVKLKNVVIKKEMGLF